MVRPAWSSGSDVSVSALTVASRWALWDTGRLGRTWVSGLRLLPSVKAQP